MPSLSDRIKEARIGLGLTQQDVADALGITKQAVSGYETGRVQPSQEVQILFTEKGVSPGWLLTGEGPMLMNGSAPVDPLVLTHRDGDHASGLAPITIPVAPNGHGASEVGRDNDGPHEHVTLSPAFVRRLTGGRLPGRLAWSYVAGESMEPWLPDGTPILIEEMEEFEDGGRYALWLDDGGEIIKRVERIGANRLLLISDNHQFPTRVLEHVEGDHYKDTQHGHTLRLRVRGRIIYPRDTAPAVIGQLADFARSLMRA